jgi:hypothetical protein
MDRDLVAAEGLLDQVHSACLIADFAKLAQLTPMVERALEQLAPLHGAQDLSRLELKALRNQRALKSCLLGVAAARRRIDEIASAAHTRTTYSEKGTRIQMNSSETQQRRF